MALAEAEIPTQPAIQAAFAEHHKHGAVRAFRAASEVIWASLESTARQVLEIAARQNSIDGEGLKVQREAVEARRGNYREDCEVVQMRGSVAVVYVEGTIFRYANIFTYYSGGTAVSTLAKDFQIVLDDQSVTDIVLYINSGGGQVDGINEFANMVYAARGRKRVWAYVSNLGCSAAYWIASATERIVCDDTAILGSIGVRCVHLDDKKALEMEGYKEIPFISSQSPNKCPDPATSKGASAIQQTLNQTAEVFISAVARNRGISAEEVITQYGAGGTTIGKYAVAAGLADELGSFEGVLAELSGDNSGNNPSTARAASLPASSTPTRGATVMADEDKTAKGDTDEKDEEEEEDMKDEKKDKEEAASTPPANTSASATAPPSASESSAEMQAQLQAAREEAAESKRIAAQANDRAAKLEAEARTNRLKVICAGLEGGEAKHLAMLEHLATATSEGEQSALFAAYVENQTALTEQIRESNLFEENGRGPAPASASSAEGQLEAKAKALMEKDTSLTYAQAYSQALDENPELYRRHKAESGS